MGVELTSNKHYPLSLGQERIWFEEQIEPGTSTYNVPYCFRGRGPINVAALETALPTIVGRHEVLRTTFAGIGDQRVQVVGTYTAAMFSCADSRNSPQPDRLAQVQELVRDEARTPFDLNTGPLVRVRLHRVDDQDSVLSFTFHHIVCDGWSIAVF